MFCGKLRLPACLPACEGRAKLAPADELPNHMSHLIGAETRRPHERGRFMMTTNMRGHDGDAQGDDGRFLNLLVDINRFDSLGIRQSGLDKPDGQWSLACPAARAQKVCGNMRT